MKTKYFVFIVVFFSFLFSATFLDRFKVPIYYTSSLSMGYDNNLFRLSALNLESNSSSNIIDSDAFDSGYITPKIQIAYHPYIFSSLKTDIDFSFTRNHYFSSLEKSFNIFYSQLGIKFAPYQSFKFAHRYIPKYYLRN